jgi:hypothetical protein
MYIVSSGVPSYMFGFTETSWKLELPYFSLTLFHADLAGGRSKLELKQRLDFGGAILNLKCRRKLMIYSGSHFTSHS